MTDKWVATCKLVFMSLVRSLPSVGLGIKFCSFHCTAWITSILHVTIYETNRCQIAVPESTSERVNQSIERRTASDTTLLQLVQVTVSKGNSEYGYSFQNLTLAAVFVTQTVTALTL